MKYLQDYIQEAQTEAFNKYGVFFAFSKEQFNEQRKEGVVYVGMGAGMVCPKGNEQKIIDALDEIHKRGIAQDIAENDKEAIIKRELANYESYYTGDPTNAIENLEMYGFTAGEVRKIFWEELPKQDYL